MPACEIFRVKTLTMEVYLPKDVKMLSGVGFSNTWLTSEYPAKRNAIYFKKLQYSRVSG